MEEKYYKDLYGAIIIVLKYTPIMFTLYILMGV